MPGGIHPATSLRDLVTLLEDLERRRTNVIDLITDRTPVEPWRLYPGETGIFDRRTRYQKPDTSTP